MRDDGAGGRGPLALGVDPASPVPPFEQVRAQLAEQIGTGALAPGDQLPPVRRLAADLGLATNTVARAYKELEQEGYVTTGGRRGTLVSDQRPAVVTEALRRTESYVAAMRQLGVSDGETTRLVRQLLYG